MHSRWFNVALPLLAAGLLLVASARQSEAQSADEILRRAGEYLASQDAEKRAKGAEAAAEVNNKKALDLILKALLIEKDTDTAVRMGACFAKFTDAEALQSARDTVTKWTRPEQIFPAYYLLTGLARGRTESGDAIIRDCVLASKPKEFNLKAAGLEAIGEGARKELAPVIAELFATWNPDWDEKGVIVAMCGIFAAPKVVNRESDKKVRDDVMRGLINILKNTKNDRLSYFAVKALSQITGEKMYQDPKFWEWWISVGGYKAAGDNPEGATTAERRVPQFFGMATVGKRIVFCIDVSGSMQHPAAMPPQPKKENPPPKKEGPTTGEKGKKDGDSKKDEKPEPDPPDYSKVKTKLDLAKVELIYTLKQLDREFLFNVVIYDTQHGLLIQGVKNLVPATDENKNRFIKAVEALNWRQLTNIHGGLMDSFSITERGFHDWKKMDPAWHDECMQLGVETVYFLTDGFPTVSDDSSDINDVGKIGPNGPIGPAVGNGKMCKPQNIVNEIKRVNTFRKAVIHTVGIGPHDGGLLRALSELSGGTYVDRTGVAAR
ncbi:MAG: hypothetical protein HUU03_09895 [Planctomycetaceae bacterium]|nr:hypothetical protein [Planctomycetaceae bacterium]